MGIFQWILNPNVPLGDWAESLFDWLLANASGFFDVIKAIIGALYSALDFVLASPPYWIMILIFAAIAFFASGWRLAVFTVIGFWLIRSFDLWPHAMDTLALVIVAVVIALVISIPLGILAARNKCVSGVVRPVMDLMQTTPTMVYLIPAIIFFGIGSVPGAVATVVFSLPPGVRLTELAIRQVDQEVVEAGQAFGSSSGRILRQIQIPLAMPTIMAGVNQVIMLALSMVVIAGMAGAEGLGKDVNESLQQLDTPLGVEAGLGVVIIAVFLDRVTSAAGQGRRGKADAG
ncbi:ABC transporter permease [Microlunatus soli]|uniref:Glycine betaine/proline transport system permease protein n=1 Tax=Microlunatus soli TaxID=630515 RepID=A0A1H1W3Z8_9ACTN|nr:ABC transporter permease subunit [Microlunatus soli]SDS91783.1 glycine betaine/proline transport system permease protein [Microlunatus soli]